MVGIMAAHRAGGMQASSSLKGALTRTPWQRATGGSSSTGTPTFEQGCPQRGVRSPKQTVCPLQGQAAVRVLPTAGGHALPPHSLNLWLGVATHVLGSPS